MPSIAIPDPDNATPSASRGPGLRHRTVAVMRWLAYGLLALTGLVSVLWLVLQWGILPRIESWRPALEQRAEAALGVPVRIGALRAVDSGLGWAGALELEQVRLLDPRSGQEALRLPRVSTALSARSLLPGWDGAWRLRLRRLSIDAPSLDVRRDADGRWRVAGLEVGAGSRHDDGQALADWFFSQPEFAIRGGRVQWHDALRAAPPVELREVDLVVRNGVRRHALRLDATPPADWGGRFSLRGEFVQPLLAAGDGQPGLLARPGDWRRWRGTAYAEAAALDLAPMQQHVSLPLEPSAGRGALRVWADVDGGRIDAVTADLRLSELRLRLDPSLEPLALTHLDGRLALARSGTARGRDAGWSLALKQLAFASADGLAWPAGDLRLAWRLGADGRPSGGELDAPQLDLGRLAAVLARLPAAWLGGDLQARLAALAPRGVAEDLKLAWGGPLDAPSSYRADGRLRGLALAAGVPAPAASGAEPQAARPGIEGLDLEFRATQAGGNATLALRNGALDFPGVFAVPRIALATLDTRLDWQVERLPGAADSRIELRLRDLRFANADAEGRVDAHWTGSSAASADAPGVLDLSAKLVRADAARVPQYLPLVVGDEVRDYLRRALLGGRALGVAVRLRGDLADFPFPEARQGEFRVSAQIDGVRFAYMPGEPGWTGDPADTERRPWPAFADVRGELVFDRQAMQLKRLSAQLPDVGGGQLLLRDVSGGIADLGADAPVLALDGRARGPLDDALRYLSATPIGGWLGDALAQATAAGGTQAPVELQLGLQIPLDDKPTRVRGALQLAGNDLRLAPGVPALTGARARIAFTEDSFTLAQGSARVLGGDAQFDGAQQPDGSLRFNVQGTLTAEALKRSAELGPLARAAAPLAGQTGYRLALGVVGDRFEWTLRSDLAGLAIDLPAPLGKRAEQVLPLRAQAALQPAAGDALPRDLLRVELGADGARLLQAQYLRELLPGGARVLRGGVALGAGALPPEPAEGVSANVEFAALDLAAWQRAADALSPGGAAAAPPAATGYLPARVSLRARELKTSGYTLHAVQATLSRGRRGDAGTWAAEIDATELAGRAEYRPAAGDGPGRIVARLARLSLPKGGDEAVSELLDRAAPSSVPALDVVVEDFELRGKKLGRLEIEAENRAAESGAVVTGDWELKRLKLASPDARLDATGRWLAAPRPGVARRAVLDFKLDVADGGGLLARLGEGAVLRGAKGRISGQIDWLGSPLDIDYASLGGQMRVEFDRGQFLQAEPGLFKLLGVLSLQSLPRRLLLDFRDVFSEGFAFDALTGDVKLAQGVAQTSNLRLRGVQAVVLLEGSADVERETQDLRVVVVPEINAGAASLAYAAINPAVGLGSFLAQLFLRRPLAEAGTREFRVTGPWAAPQVERVERRAGQAPAAADPPS